MMKIISYIIILLIMILGITFAILNADPVTVHYYVGVAQLPLSLLLVISFGVGLIFTLFFMLIVVFRVKSKCRHLKKRLKMAEKEIENLRAIPIKEEEY